MNTEQDEQARVLSRLGALESSVKNVQRSVDQLQRRLDHEAPRLHGATYRAVESLLSVYRQLDPSVVLPPLAGPVGGWAISSDMARLLCDLFARQRPTLTVELGSGTSTVLMGHLLNRFSGSRLISLEHDAVWYAHTLEMLHHSGLEDIVDLRFAPLTTVEIGLETFSWYSSEAVADVAGIDAVFVDGPPGHIGPLSRYPAGPLLAPMCSPGCLFIVDDIVRSDEQEMVARWTREVGMLHIEEHVWHGKGASVLRLEDSGGSNGQ